MTTDRYTLVKIKMPASTTRTPWYEVHADGHHVGNVDRDWSNRWCCEWYTETGRRVVLKETFRTRREAVAEVLVETSVWRKQIHA